jgi:asparagine synthase (glutamine-hydrolysing)
VNGFCGRLTALGALEFAPECSPPDECLGCQVLVSGYIADRDDLRHVFSSDAAFQPSNAELLAHAFRKWGPQLPAHVIGEYAAVVWDVRANTALLTHDSLSLAQLFYAPRSEGLAFATHVADLVDDAAAGQLDDEYLADFLARGFITGERTPYRSIRRILPGQSLWWSEGRLRPVRSWNLADVPSRRYGNDAEYEEQFRALLGAGVRASLAGPGPTFISLSGGLDSSSIACAAAGASDLAAYSVICPDWPDTDEQPWMQAVVEHCHMAWHKVDVDEILPFSTLPAGFHGEPSQIAMNEKQLRFQDDLLRSMDSTVMLTGNGGNTLLGANPGEIPVHLVDALFDGKPIAAFRALRGWRDKSNERRSYSYWLSRALMVPALEHLRGRKVSGADRRLSFPPWLKRDYAQKMHLEERARSRIAPACRNPGRQQLWDSLWTLALAMTSIQQRRMSFDIRAPLMYRPLVEFMSGIPWEQKLRPRCDRYLQRRALKGVLPELVRRRATKGSGNPALVEGLRRSSDWFDYLCDKPLMAERGIVEAAQWRDAVRQASVGQTNDDRFFLGGVAVESWLKQLKARASSARRNGLTGTRWPGVVPVLG